jgi:hypothetical protein
MVMTGYRDCTPDEATNPATGLFCAIIGKLPVVRRFDARLVSNLIQPGSSGSGVFNHEGELSGVIFAGTGDFSYGFIVPYEYVANFLNTEIDTLPELSPDSNVNILGEQNPNAKRDLDIKFADACLKITSDLCSVLDIKDMIMRKGR